MKYIQCKECELDMGLFLLLSKSVFTYCYHILESQFYSCYVLNITIFQNILEKIYDIIKGNELDVAHIDFELRVKEATNACFTLF